MTDLCECGHDAEDHDTAGCMGPPNGRYCTCLDFEAKPTDGPETAAKAEALIPKRIY